MRIEFCFLFFVLFPSRQFCGNQSKQTNSDSVSASGKIKQQQQQLTDLLTDAPPCLRGPAGSAADAPPCPRGPFGVQHRPEAEALGGKSASSLIGWQRCGVGVGGVAHKQTGSWVFFLLSAFTTDKRQKKKKPSPQWTDAGWHHPSAVMWPWGHVTWRDAWRSGCSVSRHYLNADRLRCQHRKYCCTGQDSTVCVCLQGVPLKGLRLGSCWSWLVWSGLD